MRRPRVKPEHTPYRISGGRIRIGGDAYGLAAEITDPTGLTWTVLEAMDGSRSAAEVAAEAARRHPGTDSGHVRAMVSQLMVSGYVEDAAGPEPDGLTDRDKERYDRALGYYRWLDLTPRASAWDVQARLRASSVTVLGVGGTGGIAALALAGAGVGRLHCVDHDTVELSNLSRQVIYTEDDIGTYKADAAARRLRRLNTDIAVTSQRLHIQSADDVLPLAGDCDVLLLSADRPTEVRDWVNRACLAAGRPWVDSGYHGPQVQVGVYRPGTGACRECLHDAADDIRRDIGTVVADRRRRSAAVGHAVGAVSAGISGYLAAHQVISLLADVPPATPGVIQSVNLAALDAPASFTVPRRPGCPACGGRE